MKRLRTALCILLLGTGATLCWKYYSADTPMHADDGFLTDVQADMQLRALGISPDTYSAKQLEAAEQGNTELLRLLIAAHPGRIIRDKHENTALHLSAKGGHTAACEMLSRQFHALACTNIYGQSPLHLAAAGGHTACVELLLKRGAVPDKADLNGYTPLLYAAAGGHTESARLLILAGASINSHTQEGKTIADIAEQHTDILRLIDEAAQKAPPPPPTEPSSANKLLPTQGLENERTLTTAVINNDTTLLKHLLEKGALLHEKEGESALHTAATIGATECLRQLLEYHPNVQIKFNGSGALSLAVIHGHADCAELLIRAGADVNEISATGNTPLIHAAEAGDIANLKILLAAGAHTGPTPQGSTALEAAVKNGHAECTHALIEAKADIFYVPSHHRTLLHTAAETDAAASAELLLAAGANPNARDNNHHTPLHFAAAKGHLATMRCLLAHGADAAARNDRHYTPLLTVVKEKHAHCIPALVEAGAGIDTPLPNGDTPLHLAASEGNIEELDALLKAGADPAILSADNITALEAAKINNHPLCAKKLATALLLKQGIETINEKSAYACIRQKRYDRLKLLTEAGYTPSSLILHAATAEDDKTALLLLLNATEDVHATDSEERNLLHTAAVSGSKECLRLLLRYNIQPESTTAGGKTAYQLATEHGHTECAELLDIALKLKEKGYSANTYDDELINAAKKGDHITLSRLLSLGAKITYTDADGNTALHAAAESRTVTCTKKLLEAGASPDMLNHDQKSPLMIAAKNGNSAIVRALLSGGAYVALSGGETSAAGEAIAGNQSECLQILLDAGLDVNFRDSKKRTLLYTAVIRTRPEQMQILLDRGADPNTALEGEPLLFTCIRMASPEILQMLLTHKKTDLSCKNPRGELATHIAAQSGNIGVLAFMLKNGFPPDARDNNGLNILHHAAKHGQTEIVRQLLQFGMSPLATDNRKRTPLYYAEQSEYAECAELLQKAQEAIRDQQR